jgi:cellulose synthase/poly-beta-1,6-N-acetylglucosamine synthase-like glycosyltransferase
MLRSRGTFDHVTIFLLSSAFVLYVLFGYPLIAMVWSRVRAKPVAKSFVPRTVSILLPVHNGDRWLADKLGSIRQLNYPQELLDVIVISSASLDDTVKIANEHVRPGLRVIEVEQPGKAKALNAGLAMARGEILFFTDVRQSLEPDSLRALVEHFGDPEVGVVSGELMIREGNSYEEASVGLYWKYEKVIRSAQSRIDSVPGATGAIYAMRRRLAHALPDGVLLDDVYLPVLAYFQGYRISWEPGAKAFDYPASLKTEFWRKVRTLAGVYQIIGIFPRLLVPNHRLWIHFVSHKLGRLLLPYALLAILVSSFQLPGVWKYMALVVQAGVYGLALFDGILPDTPVVKRLSSPANTFVVLMAAAVTGASVLFISPQKLWRQTR